MNDLMNGRKPNDALSVLRWGTVLFTFITFILIVWSSVGMEFRDEVYLQFVVAMYLITDFSYSFHSTFLHRHKTRLAYEEAKKNNGLKKKKSYGEVMGTVFVLCTLTIIALAGLKIWEFQVMPGSAFVAIEITVGIIATASIAKIFSIPGVPRPRHNNVLFMMSAYTTLMFMVLIFAQARWNIVIDDDFFWMYVIVLMSYVVHNVFLSISCPDYEQRYQGHKVAIGVGLFTATIVIGFPFGWFSYFPSIMVSFYIVTAIILAVGGSFKFLLNDPLTKWLMNKTKENASIKEIIEEYKNGEEDEK